MIKKKKTIFIEEQRIIVDFLSETMQIRRYGTRALKSTKIYIYNNLHICEDNMSELSYNLGMRNPS